jgi:hypothetical protein
MRSRAWLLAAVVLLAVAAWLMARGDAKEKPAKPAVVAFPRHQGREEQERSRRRRTLPPPPPKPNEDFIRPNRDPLHVALPTKKGKSAVVFEASALRESPLGKLWLDCMLSRYDLEQIERMKEEIGIDILNDVERVAVSSEKVVIATGEFAGANLKEISSTSRAYGAKGVIYEGDERGRTFAVWDRSVILMGPDVSALEASIDRLEDKVPPESPLIPEWASYGEVYGVLSADDIAQVLPESERAIAEQLRRAVEQVELHVDASEDVAIVADVEGPLEGEVDDLAKTLGAALSLGRLKAQADKDDKLAELLEVARVSPRGGRFSVEMALPLSLIQRQMGPCRKDQGADPEDLGARDGG